MSGPPSVSELELKAPRLCGSLSTALGRQGGGEGGCGASEGSGGGGSAAGCVPSARASSAQRPPGHRPLPSAGVTGSQFSVAGAQLPQHPAREGAGSDAAPAPFSPPAGGRWARVTSDVSAH